MKSKVVLPSPSDFVKANEFSRTRWRRTQHITNDFWVRSREKLLWNLQLCIKRSQRCRSFYEGYMVLLKAEANQNQRPMAKVVKQTQVYLSIIPITQDGVGKQVKEAEVRFLDKVIQC